MLHPVRSTWLPLGIAFVCFSLAGCDAPAVAADLKAETPASAAASQVPVATATAPTTALSFTPANSEESLVDKKFGAPIALTEETTLASIAASPSDYAGKTVRTTGQVKAVCQAAGCWMEIGDDTSRAHIKMANHSFFIPRRADGHTAIVEGEVKSGPPKDDCSAKDSCGGEDNGAVAKVEIVATGVTFVD